MTQELVACFRRIFMDTFNTSIDPFTRANGLPSLCALLYKTEFMEENTIQLIGDTNCIKKLQDSKVSNQYLYYLTKLDNVIGKQVRLTGRITADGYDPVTRTAYFIDGCFWHSHECQRKHGNAKHPVRLPFTHREIQEKDYDRNRSIESAGYNVYIIRECQINAELTKNTFMKVYSRKYTV